MKVIEKQQEMLHDTYPNHQRNVQSATNHNHKSTINVLLKRLRYTEKIVNIFKKLLKECKRKYSIDKLASKILVSFKRQM